MTKKTIIFDCTHALTDATGIANYLSEYINALDDSYHIILAVPRGQSHCALDRNHEIIWIEPIYPFYRKFANRFINFYLIRRNYPNAFIFSPYYDQLIFGKRSLVVIHDLAFFEKKNSYPFRIILFYYFILNLNALFVGNIGVISKTLEKIVLTNKWFFLIKRKNLIFLPNLCNMPPNQIADTTTDDVKSNRFIYFGGSEERKNIGLIQSLCKCDVDPMLNLEIRYTGPNWGDEIHGQFSKSSIKLTHLGYLDRLTLVREISKCKAVLYPSLSEGFGRPIQEAALLGIGTICLDLPVYREFFGDQPIYIDNHTQSLLDKMIEVALGKIKPGSMPYLANINVNYLMDRLF